MSLKLLRFFHIGDLATAIKRIKEYASNIFYMSRVLFDNLHQWSMAAIKLLLIMHIFSCGWLFIHE